MPSILRSLTSMLDERPERRPCVLNCELGANEIKIALLAGGHVQRSVTPHFHFLKRSRPKRDVLAAATGIRSVAVVLSRAIRENGDYACAERTPGTVPMLHGKLPGLSLPFGLPALLLLLRGIFLFFLLDVALHLSQFEVVGEIAGELEYR